MLDLSQKERPDMLAPDLNGNNLKEHSKGTNIELLNQVDPAGFGQNIINGVDNSIEALRKDFRIITAGDLLARGITKIPSFLGDLIPAVGVVILAGSSDAGKSMWTRDLALRCAGGFESFLDFQFAPGLSRKAIIVCSEDDEFAISYLLGRQTLGLTPDIIARTADNLYFLFDNEDLLDRLNQILSRLKVDLIVIDTLGDLPNDIKDNSEMRKLISGFKDLAVKYECLILLMHHTNKRTENQAPNKSNIQGAGGMEQKCRLALELRSDPNNTDIKHLSVLKGNYLPKEYKNASFVLNFDPETFTFSNTGQRVSFDDLTVAVDADRPKPGKKFPNYTDKDIEIWRSYIRPVFQKRTEGYLISDLWPLAAERFRVQFELPTAPGRDKTTAIINQMIGDSALLKPLSGSKNALITFNEEFTA